VGLSRGEHRALQCWQRQEWQRQQQQNGFSSIGSGSSNGGSGSAGNVAAEADYKKSATLIIAAFSRKQNVQRSTAAIRAMSVCSLNWRMCFCICCQPIFSQAELFFLKKSKTKQFPRAATCILLLSFLYLYLCCHSQGVSIAGGRVANGIVLVRCVFV
jgi:hypothetical protein